MRDCYRGFQWEGVNRGRNSEHHRSGKRGDPLCFTPFYQEAGQEISAMLVGGACTRTNPNPLPANAEENRFPSEEFRIS